jgi:Fe-S cluster assembly ATP-binding protein
MLKISNLTASINDKTIIHDVSLTVNNGECLLITGHNGSGKSTLLHSIMGRPDIEVRGKISLNDIMLTNLECHHRAREGVFMFHQTPPDINGVNTMTLLNEINKINNNKYTRTNLIAQANDLFLHMNLPSDWSKRQFNMGASGGERKKNELAHARLFDNQLLLLDEPDSGMDQASKRYIFELIEERCHNGAIVLLVSHDTDIQNYYIKNRINLQNGKLS